MQGRFLKTFPFQKTRGKLLFLVLALLVSNGAGGLASRLAGSLALAAAALGSGFFQIAFVERLYVFHSDSSFMWE